MNRRYRAALILAVLSVSAGCDQATKQIAERTLAGEPGYSFLGGTFRLQYAENHGAMLSLGNSLPTAAREAVFIGGVGLFLFVLLGYALFTRHLTRAQAVGYALVTSGGLSNWMDRVLRDGAVIDFMNVGAGSLRTGIFNVADIAIFAGVGVLLAFQKATATPPEPHP
jgi:signal peptidase II